MRLLLFQKVSLVSIEWHMRGWPRTAYGLLPARGIQGNVEENMQENINVEGDDVRMEQLLTDHDTGYTIDELIQDLRGQDTSAAALILE